MSDGGSAFPMVLNVNLDQDHKTLMLGNIQSTEGMSLRDWFAGMIINGYHSADNQTGTDKELAKSAYEAADAMIAQREKEAGK